MSYKKYPGLTFIWGHIFNLMTPYEYKPWTFSYVPPCRMSVREEKLKLRKYNSKTENPPNVVIFGVDSTSRLNFRRNMPKTIKFMESVGATEMLGYTKVGENTWPNVVPLLTGYDNVDFSKACYYSRSSKLDACPFIWHRFSEAGYLTAEIQDSPRRNSWNFEKIGFVDPPTDFYLRPFMVAVHLNEGFYPDRLQCVGSQSVQKTIWNYIRDVLNFSSENQTPLFLMSWLTDLAHDNLNSLQFGDEELSTVLEDLNASGSLSNTILIVLSDHGYRFGGIRQTVAGYYEDKLPNLWIRLPSPVIRKLPNWINSLRLNSRRLTSTYDMYRTLTHILDTYANFTSETIAKTRYGSVLDRLYGISLLESIPEERSCTDTGIPSSYCPCYLPVRLSSLDIRLVKAAEAVIKFLNSQLPPECSQLALEAVKGGALLNGIGNGVQEDLIVDFMAVPGEFILEATVTSVKKSEYDNSKASDDVTEYLVKKNVQRLSQFKTEVSCVKDQKIQLYCHCT